MADINDSTLEKLYKLSRIQPEADTAKREKLLRDIQKVLEHFKELEEVDTSDTEPLAGGSFLLSVSREDVPNVFSEGAKEEFLVGQFPDTESGYLKVPPVF